MALILRGKSRCAACGQIIGDDDEATGLPHFATGPEDVHWRFNDAPFHLTCYLKLPERPAIETRVDEARRQHAASKRATEEALLRAWRNADDLGRDERVPSDSDWIEEFDWAGFGHRVEDGWRFTKFGVEHARALDAADSDDQAGRQAS